MIRKITIPIIERRTIAKNTIEIVLDASLENFTFLAGQYVKISIPKMLYPDPAGNYRMFSIASSPNEKSKMEIVFRDSQSGFKKTLTELPFGSSVIIQGPYGLFTLPKNPKASIVFIAGGVGIAPCLSMIRFAIEEKLEREITLLYANNDLKSAAYLDELKEIEQNNSRFFIKCHLGLIDENCVRQSVADINQPIWYAVGPPKMVRTTRDILEQLGVSKNKIRFENF